MPVVSRPQLVAYALAALVVVVLGVRFMQGQARGSAAPEAAASGPASGRVRVGFRVRIGSVRLEPRPATSALVHVAGAVRSPGVYRLRDGERVQDAVRRAGGPRAGADLNAINLAAKVADGQQVVVPRRGAAGAAPVGGARSGRGWRPRRPTSAAGQPQYRDGRAARHPRRRRPGHGEQDPRIPPATRRLPFDRRSRRDPRHRPEAPRRAEGQGPAVTAARSDSPADASAGAGAGPARSAPRARASTAPRPPADVGRRSGGRVRVDAVRELRARPWHTGTAALVAGLLLGPRGTAGGGARRARGAGARLARARCGWRWPAPSSPAHWSRRRAWRPSTRPVWRRASGTPCASASCSSTRRGRDRSACGWPRCDSTASACCCAPAVACAGPPSAWARCSRYAAASSRCRRRTPGSAHAACTPSCEPTRSPTREPGAEGSRGWSTACGRGRRRSCAAGVPPPEAALLRGMALGDDAALPDRTRDEFRASGLSHLVAASGQNVMLLAALVLGVAAVLGLALRARLALVLGAIALYVPLAGGGPSIQRAGVMGAAAVVAVLAGRPAARWHALLLATAVDAGPQPAGARGRRLAAELRGGGRDPAAGRARPRRPGPARAAARPRRGDGPHGRGDAGDRAAHRGALRPGLAGLAARPTCWPRPPWHRPCGWR